MVGRGDADSAIRLDSNTADMTFAEWKKKSAETNENAEKTQYEESSEENEQNGFTSDDIGGIINTEVFHSINDPMFEVTGSAFDSNKKEVEQCMNLLKSWGVEVKISDSETMGYGSVTIGKPGVMSISNNSSYSAFMHEFQHVIDDKDAGWNAVYVLYGDMDERIRRETVAYQVEIDMAKKFGRDDIVKRLEGLLNDEIKHIENFFSQE